MKMLSNETKKLLDKLYNLRGKDSVILTKMNKEREEAIETQERTKNEKTVLLEKIDALTKDEETLAKEGEKLTSVLGSINRKDFATVLDRLKIDFDPEEINAKVSAMLPDTIEKVVEENKKASEALENVEAEMNNAITRVEELGIRKDEALSNQTKLNEFFDLALAGNINITRDEITGLLEKFDFDENEQREAAKILMFPEDALYEYDASLKSTPDKEVKAAPVVENIKKETVQPEAPKEIEVEPVKQSSEGDSMLENIFDQVVADNVSESELNAAVDTKTEKEKLVDLLNSEGLVATKFENAALEKVLANYDEEVIKNNIGTLKSNKVVLDILVDNPEMLYDKELKAKIEKLMTIGKDAKDISLTPHVLVKYDLKGLNNTISVLQISGLDPKKVPLLAY